MPIEKLKYNNFDALLETCYDIYKCLEAESIV